MKVKVNLDTFSACQKFVDICSKHDADIHLTDGNHYRVSAKSLLGAMASFDWTEVWVESDTDFYCDIQEFAD